MPLQDGCAERLEALGLRVGKVIEKVSGMPFHGPVTLLLDGRQIAIGWKISSSILVSPFYISVKARTTSPARMSPAAPGTQLTLPGDCLRRPDSVV